MTEHQLMRRGLAHAQRAIARVDQVLAALERSQHQQRVVAIETQTLLAQALREVVGAIDRGDAIARDSELMLLARAALRRVTR